MAIEPLNPIPTQQPRPQATSVTPEQIKAALAYAQLLQQQQQQKPPFYTWANGLADMSSKMMAGQAFHDAMAAERAQNEQVARGAVAGLPDSESDDLSKYTESTERKSVREHLLDAATPASIRSNNPGAAWGSPLAAQFGSTGSQHLKSGNQIATFDDPESGAAYQFALLNNHYQGMPLSNAIARWSGNNNSGDYLKHIESQTGLKPDTILSSDLLSSPQGLALVKSMAHWEAGKAFPLSDDQWARAQARALSGQRTPAGASSPPAVVGPGGGSMPPSPGGLPPKPVCT